VEFVLGLWKVKAGFVGVLEWHLKPVRLWYYCGYCWI
jgi:hypothetical protein